jgi:adenylate kinase
MSDLFHTVLLFGAPGSGKGTQGRALGSIPGFFHCACGDVFRRINPSSRLGKVFMEYSSRGELVPDDVTIELWLEHIHAQEKTNAYKPQTDVLVLDGIPRNVTQARMMDKHLHVLKLIELDCPDEDKMVERMRRRALKENRLDDAKEEVVRNRFVVYHDETAPVLEHYAEALKVKVNALQSPAEVLRDVLAVVVPVQNEHFARLGRQEQGV